MKLTPTDMIGRTVTRVLSSEPAARFYSERVVFLLFMNGAGFAKIGCIAIWSFGDVDVEGMYRATGWNHQNYLKAEELEDIVCGHQLKRIIITQSTGYDTSMVVFSNDVVIGNCSNGRERFLYVRTMFDNDYESKTEYWDYFTGERTDHLGNRLEGDKRVPFQVGWV